MVIFLSIQIPKYLKSCGRLDKDPRQGSPLYDVKNSTFYQCPFYGNICGYIEQIK